MGVTLGLNLGPERARERVARTGAAIDQARRDISGWLEKRGHDPAFTVARRSPATRTRSLP
jgi:hypothetical protein